MAADTHDKGKLFANMHRRERAFVMPNAWDAGSARLLAGLGFKAVATSSAAMAGTLGRRDGQVARDEAIAHARAVVAGTKLPVSADLEQGYGDAPKVVARTIEMAGEIGLAGASIEDASGRSGDPIYDIAFAAERVAAAVEAARRLGYPFTLTARAENFLHGRGDLDDTIRRLQAYEQAGADVLFAPGLPDLDAVRTVCASLTKPVSFMAAIPGKSFSVAELEAAGVKRISLAATLYRAAMTGLLDAAREVAEKGTFGFLDRVASTSQLNELMKN
jgi:2-methylisocitrate lyase-like PEP mutase family enzyme